VHCIIELYKLTDSRGSRLFFCTVSQ